MPEAVARQNCPNCGLAHDVSVYVSGQRVRCRCGLHFDVQRPNVAKGPAAPPARPVGAGQSVTAAAPAAPAPLPEPIPSAGPELAATVVGRALQIPGYELLEVIGRGGMGEVWKARQLSLGRVVAIKVLAAELAKDPTFVARFEKETAALAALSHPNIIQIIDRGFCDAGGTNTWYFAMELFEGRCLRELISPKGLGPREALRLVAQVCRGIDAAHRRGIIHRDLKPENILVDADGHVKVVDFGLAGLRDAEARLNVTRTATAMGTLHYMAPEQRRDARSVDERADLYSLGVILYELLTGEVPMGRFLLPSERLEGVDTRVDKIVAKALEPKPEARYATAQAMSAELDALLSTVAERPLALPGSDPAPARRRGLVATLARFKWVAVVGLALSGVALGLAFSSGAFGRLGRPGRHGPDLPPGAPPRDVAHDASVDLRIQLVGDVGQGQLSFLFQPGPAVLKAFTDGWSLEQGVLVARNFGEAESSRPRRWHVFLEEPEVKAEGLTLESAVSVDRTPPPGYQPRTSRAEISLRGDKGASYVRLSASFGPRARYTLAYRFMKGDLTREEDSVSTEGNEAIAPPEERRSLRLRLLIQRGEIVAGAGEREPLQQIFHVKAPVGDLSGQILLSCAEATCRFSEVKASMRPAREGRGREPVKP